MKLFHLLFALTWTEACVKGFNAANNAVHHQELGTEWVFRESIPANHVMSFRFVLRQQNLHKGMDYLMEISDPASPKYSKHYTTEQVKELFAPRKEVILAAKSWLIRSGVPAANVTSSRSRGWLDVTAKVGVIETILQANYSIFAHVSHRSLKIATNEYTIPEEVAQAVDFVLATTPPIDTRKSQRRAIHARDRQSYASRVGPVPHGRLQKLVQNPEDITDCVNYMTPACISAMYDIPKGNLSASTNRLGLFELDQDVPVQSDLATFYQRFAPHIPPQQGPERKFIDFPPGGHPNGSRANGEAALDFDMAQPILFPQSTVLFQTNTRFSAPNGTIGLFNQFLDAIDGVYCHTSAYGEHGDNPTVDGVTPNEMCGVFNVTNVLSFSYGYNEASYPVGYLKRQCDEFMKLGLQGVSVVFASGDSGVAGGHGNDCLGKDKSIFNPQYGASWPYVTSVGASTLPPGSRPGDPEQASLGFSSGGGFSNVWEMPLYQAAAVMGYLDNHNPGFPSYNTTNGFIPSSGKGLYNKRGRGIPDIAAVGEGGVVVKGGHIETYQGTSMSTPIIASILTRINEERIATGKPRIGFANPALYANPGIFFDIKAGGQSGQGACLGKGFNATEGWDPVTGLGSPNYPAMLEYFMGI